MSSIYQENGPQTGSSYRLTPGKTVVGRHPDCDVVVDVGAVSRKHAQFLEVGGQYFVEDLNSRNGTFVNGEMINGRYELKLGDRIQVCDITFRFDMPSKEPPAMTAQPGVLIEDSPQDSSRIMSSLDLMTNLSGGVEIAATAEVKLQALLEITRSLTRALAIDDVMPRLLDELFKIFVQADRGFVILRGPDDQLIPRHTKLRRGDDDRMIRLSKTIIDQVMNTKQAILSTDTMDDQRFQLSESIANFRIRSFICAPLPDAEGNILGAIQLDSLDSKHRFRDNDLDLLLSVAGQAGLAIDNAQLHDQVVRQRVLERDLELASDVQKGFLPSRVPKLDRFELSEYYEPADMVGGDFYDFIPLPDNRMAIVLADVVGHGMAAALQTAQLSTALKFVLSNQTDPAKAIQELNERLYLDSLDDRFITLCMLMLDMNESKISIVNAGHMPPLLCRNGQDPVELGAEVRALPLLIMDSCPYQSVDVDLQAGDLVLMYTDGLTESMNADGELYGTDRLVEQARKTQSGEELTQKLVKDAKIFSGSVPQLDDICLVGCSRKANS